MKCKLSCSLENMQLMCFLKGSTKLNKTCSKIFHFNLALNALKLKGIVHPKIKMVIIYSPSSYYKPV